MVTATPLDRLAAGRISWDRQWSARSAICRNVRGEAEHGPRYRRGSNSWRPNDLAAVINPALPHSPCPNCGADGGEMGGGVGYAYCPACQEEVQLGDYDWTSLSDCLRYRSDVASGLVETEEELFRCEGCSRPLLPLIEDLRCFRYDFEIDCARSDCLLRPPPPPPPPRIPRMSKALRSSLLARAGAIHCGGMPKRVVTALVKRGWAGERTYRTSEGELRAYVALTTEGDAIARELRRRAMAAQRP